MKNSALLLIVFAFAALSISAQESESCAVHLGNNYFVDCQQFIVYRGDEIVNQSEDRTRVDGFSLQIYSNSGRIIASLEEGKLVSGSEDEISVIVTETEFSVTDVNSGHIYCLIKETYNDEKAWCQFDVWMDILLADGNHFQCTPESSNIPMLQYMEGSTFSGASTAITLDFY